MIADPRFPQRPYGLTGLPVTSICIGCAPLGDMPDTFNYSVSEEQALATLRAVFHSPFNFLDTAASYGDGESERRIGMVLREMGGLPPGVVLGTKADRNLQTGEYTGDQMQRSVERSLRLLGLDRLQLVYLHDPEHITFEAAMAPGGPVEVLLRLKDEGVIDHVGVAGGPIDLMIQFVETGLFEAVITHNRYTLIAAGSAAAGRRVAAQAGRLKCRALRQRDFGQGPGQLPALYVWPGLSAADRPGAAHRRRLPALCGAAGRGRAAILAARSARTLDHSGPQQAPARGRNRSAGDAPDPGRVVGGNRGG